MLDFNSRWSITRAWTHYIKWLPKRTRRGRKVQRPASSEHPGLIQEVNSTPEVYPDWLHSWSMPPWLFLDVPEIASPKSSLNYRTLYRILKAPTCQAQWHPTNEECQAMVPFLLVFPTRFMFLSNGCTHPLACKASHSVFPVLQFLLEELKRTFWVEIS